MVDCLGHSTGLASLGSVPAPEEEYEAIHHAVKVAVVIQGLLGLLRGRTGLHEGAVVAVGGGDAHTGTHMEELGGLLGAVLGALAVSEAQDYLLGWVDVGLEAPGHAEVLLFVRFPWAVVEVAPGAPAELESRLEVQPGSSAVVPGLVEAEVLGEGRLEVEHLVEAVAQRLLLLREAPSQRRHEVLPGSRKCLTCPKMCTNVTDRDDRPGRQGQRAGRDL